MTDSRSPLELSAATLAHYQAHAHDYRRGTADHDVSQNIAALLRAIRGEAPFTILDFGCGPGRDLKTLAALGHRAIGLDGAPAMVELARADSGCDVWLQDFVALDLPSAHFDGVFANATLFHVPRQAIRRVLGELRAALRPGGVLFCSNPRGEDREGCVGTRYACYYHFDTWRALVLEAGFEEVEHYYRPPGLPREQQPWLATVWRRPAQPR